MSIKSIYVGLRHDFDGMYKDCNTLEKLANKVRGYIEKDGKLPPGYTNLDDFEPEPGTRI